MLQIRNLRIQTESIHQEMHRLTMDALHGCKATDPMKISQKMASVQEKVESLCQKHGGTPADMGTPSYRIYLWLRFLSASQHLDLHLDGLQKFTQLIADQKPAGVLDHSGSLVKIDFSGYLFQRKTTRGATRLLINESFIDAPQKTKEDLIHSVFARRQGKSAETVKAYANSAPYLRMGRRISGKPIANQLSCRGARFDLALLFNDLNARYFGSSLPRPRLVWSSVRAQRRLGYYHPEIHTIAVNQKMDKAGVPQLLAEYILYHEMLHQHFGIEHRNGRRYAHTAAFHHAEKQFEKHQEAENLIKFLQ